MRDNVVYGMEASSLLTPTYRAFSRNNLVTNNLFLDARGAQIYMVQSNFDTFTRNVVSFSLVGAAGPTLFEYVGADAIQTSDYNLYFSPGNPDLFSQLKAFRAFGFDAHSQIADPELIRVGDTYTLSVTSPAYALGFVPIDPAGNGPIGVECFDDAGCAATLRCVQRQCK